MPAPGDIFGHYRIEEQLGEGAFGTVFRGEDIRLHRKVAVKILHARIEEDPEAWGRLLREARAVSALNHPNICALYDIGEEEGLGYFAMEYVEGRSLGEILRDGPLPVATALSYAVQMAGALAHAHGRGIVHRDLKASNVMITPGSEAKLLDFGLARRLGSLAIESVSKSRQSLTDLGGLAGTLCYMAPEVLRGKPADVRSDLWSLGALLYETLCGRLPFQGETPFELSLAIMVEEPPALPPGLPVSVRAIVTKCLEKDPQQRYGNCEELRAALERARAELGGSRWRSLFRIRSLGLAAFTLVLVLGLVLGWRRHHEGTAAVAPRAGAIQTPLPQKQEAAGPPASIPTGPAAGRAAKRAAPPSRKFPGDPNIEVWANSKSKVYHCPGSRWYRRTAQGELLKQREAQLNGYHPASGLACP
ncbi:MAG TPA: serine/threonine-protein kinase [Terriglobia bacterium]|nr:serine/threonine-protein kinase [Terriglobia bacterium]